MENREGGTLNCAPSADAVAGNGRLLSYSLRSPSAHAVAGATKTASLRHPNHALQADRMRRLLRCCKRPKTRLISGAFLGIFTRPRPPITPCSGCPPSAPPHRPPPP